MKTTQYLHYILLAVCLGGTPGHAQSSHSESQPLIRGGGFMPHDRVEPATGNVAGYLFERGQELTPTRRDTKREMRVQIDWTALEQLDPAKSDNRLFLPVFDELLEVSFFHHESRGETRYTWFGRIAGIALSDVILVRHRDALVVQIRDYPGNRTWLLNRNRSKQLSLRQLGVDESASDPCGVAGQPAPVNTYADQEAQGGSSQTAQFGGHPDPTDQIDALFVATTECFAEFGGVPSNFEATCELFAADFNMRCMNSNVDLTMRVAGVISESGYSEDSDGGVDLDRCTDDLDGFLDSVHGVRDDCRADIVCLFRSETWGVGYFGIAWRPWDLWNMEHGLPNGFEGGNGFSVTAFQGDTATTFSHEVGHNLGACHNAALDGCEESVTSAPHGMYAACPIFPGQACVLTTMSYNPHCLFGNTRIPYWSGENLTYNANGDGCGDLNLWDSESKVEELMNISRPTLSQNRIGSTLSWVCPDADSGAAVGTMANPFPTVADGVATVQGGANEGVVRVKAGTYDETTTEGGPVIYSNPCWISPEGGVVTIQ